MKSVICDAVIAPGYEPGAMQLLASQRGGRFLIFEADPTRRPPARERRDVLGVTIKQDRDAVPLESVLPDDGRLDAATREDALLGLVTLRYTQSNSVALLRAGAAIGIGAGQQKRVDCVRLAGTKARIWWLRRHRLVDELPAVDGMGRQECLNWQIRFAGQEMTASQLDGFEALFEADARRHYDDPASRARWTSLLQDVTMVSDGYLPFPTTSSTPSRLGCRPSWNLVDPLAAAKSPAAPPSTASTTPKPGSGPPPLTPTSPSQLHVPRSLVAWLARLR